MSEKVAFSEAELCIALAKADSEEKAISLLKREGLWQDNSVWVNYGGFENNFSTIGNQQNLPEAALVEKIVNSVDALLIREAMLRGIAPESSRAPQSIREAVEKFFDISEGILSRVSAGRRSELAENIALVASGSKSNPCYSVIDVGEGQSPDRMPETFLALSVGDSNKARIPFVQGKFKMGGTGSFQFCGKDNLQLIVSKRDPELAKKEKHDNSADCWGFTVIRRKNPEGQMRSSVYQYLAPNKKILRFKRKTLPLLPSEYPDPNGRPLEWGTFLKLYDYQIGSGLRSYLGFDLSNRLSLLMPSIALPIRLFERRAGYNAHTYESTLAGLSVRLDDDKGDNLEEGYPSTGTLTVSGQRMQYLIYAFKRGQAEKYRKDEGIIFTINGQTHGSMSKDFFKRKSVGMSYLADSLLVLVDCSNFDGRAREDLFMNSRDRLRDVDLKHEIFDVLEELISKHPGLRTLQQMRRQEDVANKLADSKPLVDLISDVLKKSPALAALFGKGLQIPNPFVFTKVVVTKDYEGKDVPTYFRIKGHAPLVKNCPMNLGFRVQFETDANNSYFDEETSSYPGEFFLNLNEVNCKDFTFNLWNGIATLTVHSLPEDAQVGQKIKAKTLVNGKLQDNAFENDFEILVEPAIVRPQVDNKPGKDRKPRGKDEGQEENAESKLSLPNVVEVEESNWNNYEPIFTKHSALRVQEDGNGSYDFFVNIHNLYLLNEIKQQATVDPRILQARFKFALVLVGLALLKAQKKNEEESGSTLDKVAQFSEAISPVILPMISALGELSVDDI